MSKFEEREARVATAKRKSFVQTIVNENNAEPPTKNNEKFKQRSYYLTDELLKAITIKTSESELDKSGVVREALKIYLANILDRPKL
jgi:hypothetical protein